MEKQVLKILAVFLVAVFVVLSVLFAISMKKLAEYKSRPIKIKPDFTYTAHTGCVYTKDNSLNSIEVGVFFGADIVEFDVQYYNGLPVLAHDKPTGKEVTLEEAFLKVKEYDNLKVNVDIKSIEHLHTVGEVAEKTGVKDRIFFTGINEEFVDAVKSECPDIEYYLNVKVLSPNKHTDEYLNSLVEKVKSSGAVGINFNKDSASERLVEVFHENDLLVSIWTASDYKDIYKILSFGPDNITTRRPDRLKQTLEIIDYNE